MGSPFGPEATLALFVAVGFFGSGHCLGMCGPLLSLYADRMPERRGSALRQQALFNLGRTVSYTLLGALFGAAGWLVAGTARGLPGPVSVVRGTLGVVVGLVVLAAGLSQLVGARNPLLVGRVQGLWAPLGRLSRVVRHRLEAWLDGPMAAVLGLAHGLFPCPLLYPAYLYAFALGDPLDGALALAALGVGTLPAVVAFGLVVDPVRVGRLGTAAVGAAFGLLGIGTLAAGLAALGLPVPRPAALGVALPTAGPFPVVVAVPVAVVGSLLLLGAAVTVLVRRQSLAYLFVVLALVAFAGGILVDRLAAGGSLPAATARDVTLLADAAVVVLLAAAVHAAARGSGPSDEREVEP